MDREQELAVVRRAYAKQVMAVMGTEDPRVEAAFAKVRREHFLGGGPWQILQWSHTYRQTPSDDPVYLYSDDLVALDPARHVNNGQPSYHAMMIARAAAQPASMLSMSVPEPATTLQYSLISSAPKGKLPELNLMEHSLGERLRIFANGRMSK